MPEDIQYCRNMQHVLTTVINSVAVDGSTYVNFTRTIVSKDVMLHVPSLEPGSHTHTAGCQINLCECSDLHSSSVADDFIVQGYDATLLPNRSEISVPAI